MPAIGSDESCSDADTTITVSGTAVKRPCTAHLPTFTPAHAVHARRYMPSPGTEVSRTVAKGLIKKYTEVSRKLLDRDGAQAAAAAAKSKDD